MFKLFTAEERVSYLRHTIASCGVTILPFLLQKERMRANEKQRYFYLGAARAVDNYCIEKVRITNLFLPILYRALFLYFD